MWQVDATTRADGTSPIASALAEPWHPDFPPVHVRSSSNFVFAFSTGGRPCFLRFARVGDRGSASGVRAELAVMARARAAGIRTPEPVAAANGEFMLTSAVDGESYVTVALTALPGEELDADEVSLEHCRAWGALVARLEHALDDPQLRDDAGNRHLWTDQAALMRSVVVSGPLVVWNELEEVTSRMSDWSPRSGGDGMFHLDLELDNLRWDGLVPTVLDFDDCAWSFAAIDVASAMRDLARDPVHSGAFLEAYEAAGGPFVRDRLPDARRWLALTTYTTIIRSLDLIDLSGAPQWLVDLHRALDARRAAYVDRLQQR